MSNQIITTNDGSHTIYVESLDEHYHSTNGAIQEALHVYIAKALRECHLDKLTVFEVGFGTGLNALLTAIEADKTNKEITYISIEKYPISEQHRALLNFSKFIDVEYASIFEKIHSCEWNKLIEITPHFKLHKIEDSLLHFPNIPDCDVIYFDAFAPNKQPEMWSIQIFEYLFQKLRYNGILSTYCAKGEVRRNLQQVGFNVVRTDGPIGKREILQAFKIS